MYQDSGFHWIGRVPKHWELRPVSSCFRERRDKVSDKDYPPLSVTKNGIVPQLDNAAKTDDNDNRRLVCCGDFVINSRSDRKGSSGKASEDGSVSLINTVIEPNEDIEIDFAHHLFRSTAFQEEYYRFGKGIVADLWSTNYSAMKRICLAVPPLSEQQTIASFLDTETSKIDGLVAEQRRLIELLKEKRQAVISHAVTKGLNPNTPMKPSGIQWLGDVPEHWDVISLKHLVARPIIDGPHVSPQKHDEGVPFISAESIGKGFIDFDKKWGYISPEDHELYSQRYKPERGDILLVKLGATTGVPAIVETDTDFNIWVPLAAIRLRRDIHPRFIFHVLRSNNLRVAYELNWTYGTQQTLGLGTISNLPMPVPPKDERKEIVNYLDSILPGFDSLEAESERAIELLQERRTALISAAVTGKIDVRGLTSSERLGASRRPFSQEGNE